tara:strand:+ start:668 stop:2050 length:1383 start_codon:yes stop_codon:yes gene_type:complete
MNSYPKLKIVVPTFNTEKWIMRCLHSIAFQEYPNWECIVINDASTDNTQQAIDSLEFVEKDPRFKVLTRENNVKALQNIVDGFNMLNAKDDPESILMVIDGDDWLFSEWSLAIVSNAYSSNKDLLLTYGNWVGYPDGQTSNNRPIPPIVHEQGNYRELPFAFSHLRTFKSKLWYNIKDEDLRDEDGKYFTVGWDVSFMLPMLEMARDRAAMIPNILYCYNRVNPISDDKIRQQDQIRVDKLVRTRKKYDPIFDYKPPTQLEKAIQVQNSAVIQWKKQNGDETLRLDYDLNENSTVLDFGGFKGEWAEKIHEKHKCNVHVYEPFKKFYKTLELKFAGNDKITVYPVGIGATTRKINMIEDGLATRIVEDPKGKIQLKSINSILEKFENIDLLKMNIEGTEYEILDEMIKSGDILKVKDLQVQFHPVDENSPKQMHDLQKALKQTHDLTYFFPFIWENWRRK